MHIAMHILHATAVLVIAFFVWFAAVRSEGWLKLAGKVLGVWLVLVAVASILIGVFGPKHHHGMGADTGDNAAAASGAMSGAASADNAAANTSP